MLGVLKRRWKPKRGVSNNNNNNNNNNNARRQSKTDSTMPGDVARTATSPRAIHPVSDEKAALVVAYGVPSPTLVVGGGGSDACTEAAPGGGGVYPLAPNICVEAGRIEFIKPTQDSATSPAASEKSDPAKEWLERRVPQLEEALEEERRAVQRERMVSSKLQRQMSRREVAQRDVDRERRLRCDSEARLRSSLSDADRCRTRLTALQKEFARMEETVRSMLQYKSRCELLKHEKASLALAYESRVQQFQSALNKLSQENDQLKKQLRTFEGAAAAGGGSGGDVAERLHELERDNTVLTREGETQRRQYERCLDDVANQVVRALLAQKGLREEIGGLHRRIRELETQNRALSTLLIQQLQQNSPCAPCPLLPPCPDANSKPTKATVKFALPGGRGTRGSRPSSCDEARLRLWEESVVWLPVQRPRSLNLDTCCQYRHRARPLLSPLNGGGGGKKSGGEDEGGSESPESGNRDEGYSTMSSDVQGPLEAPRRGLEDLKEASDETDAATVPADCTQSPDRLLDVPETPDLVLIPLSVAVSANTRHSFPPVQGLLPFQHIMRSFSDSHLCLKLTPNSPSPSYSLTSAESLFLFGEKSTPLRRSRATTSLLCTAVQEEEDDSGSWSSAEYWDTDYVQHWLRLDETRSQLQQQMEYDAAELEDWTMEETEFWRRSDPLTPNQPCLPSIQETNASELEEDANECLWNCSSYLVDGTEMNGRCLWPYSTRCLISPGGDSWSSVGTNSEDGKSCADNCQNGGSKRSSTAMSTDSGESPAVGTDFTRDFYRLVKFESTKSLASTSSRSDNVALRRSDIVLSSDREQALQSVLHFIAEQQQYCRSREVNDCRPNDVCLEEMSPPDKYENDDRAILSPTTKDGEKSSSESPKINITRIKNTLNVAKVTPPDRPTEDANRRLPVPEAVESADGNNDCLDLRCCGSKSDELLVSDSDNKLLQVLPPNTSDTVAVRSGRGSDAGVGVRSQPADATATSTLAARETEREELNNNNNNNRLDFVEPPSLIPKLVRPDLLATVQRPSLRPVPEEDEDRCSLTAADSHFPDVSDDRPLNGFPASLPTNEFPTSLRPSEPAIASLPDQTVLLNDSRILSFHERASSKDVIDELNRMIRKGEEGGTEVEATSPAANLDLGGCCCPTGWVHVERDIDFTDPKARANLLDVMLAASRSSSSAGSASGSAAGSSSDSEVDDPPDYHHLHRLHRFRRQKKASANREPLGALRCTATTPRPTIIGRDDFYVRYGEKEREAVASFDFLEELSTTSLSGASSCDNPPTLPSAARPRDSSPADRSQSQTPDPDPDLPEHLSLSDSCAASFSGSEPSLEMQ